MRNKYQGTERERKNAASREWKRRNKAHVKQKLCAWLEKNKERREEYNKAYREANRDRQRQADYERYRRPENVLKREATKEKRAEYNREFRKKNLHIWREANASRKASKRGTSSPKERKLIAQWFQNVNLRKRNTCFWCGTSIPRMQHHFDHITPLSKGGIHALSNLCVSCPECNMSKHDKDITRWNQEISQPVLL